MAPTKNPRMDGRHMSSYSSTMTIVMFIILCLVGVWMMTSSTIIPVQNIEMSADEANTELKGEVVIENESQPFQESSAGVPNDTNPEVNQNKNPSEKKAENQVEESKEGKNSIKESDETENKSNDPPERESENRSGETSKTETSNEEDSIKDSEGTKKKINESNNALKIESEDGNKSDERSKTETKNEPDDTSKTETGNGSDDTIKNEADKESDGALRTKITNESYDESKTENENEENEKKKGEETIIEQKEPNTKGGETNERGQSDAQGKESEVEKNSELEEILGETAPGKEVQGQAEEKVEQNQGKEPEQISTENKTEDQVKDHASIGLFPDLAQSELLNETITQNGTFSTQAVESKNEKQVQQSSPSEDQTVNKVSAEKEGDPEREDAYSDNWKLCNVTVGADYIPCLDNEEAIKKLRSTKHYEHRERHCPEEGPTCFVPLPEGYKQPIRWPNSRDKIWYHNVPHTQLALFKGHQNWVKVTGEYLTFPGGGTQFKHGALHYIEFIEESVPKIAWGRRSRVVLDVGCGVASFGGYLFEKDVLTMSFAPKDEHEAQVQFALERGIPALSAVMGTKRLPFPSKVFDIVHCARCRVPWHIEGGTLLLELNRVLRPGGYFVWSATPVYKKSEEDVGIWNAMSSLTTSMCWDLVSKSKDKLNRVGVAVYRKPSSNDCYEKRVEPMPPLCEETDDPDAVWNVPLQACMHRVPVGLGERGSQWPKQWPQRLEKTPFWLNDSQVGVYGKAAPKDFETDYAHWKRVVSKSYLNGMGINWSVVRNVMDMRSTYGGFAAALRDITVWVMNVVTVDSADTLPIIYERGLFGIYHDWCESFNTYPRTYDLLHADHLFSKLKKRCKILPVIVEVDRILRPEGKLVVRDTVDAVSEIENLARSLHWEIRLTYVKDNQGLLCAQKTMWRPQEVETASSVA